MGFAADYFDHREELVADFRQFYSLDLPVEGDEVDDPVRMAALWRYLPRESRTVQRRSPDDRWSETDRLLWSIEYGVRCLAWMQSKDGSKGHNKPRPIETPGQSASAHKRAKSALSSRSEIDRILGLERLTHG